jgi:Cof subfamily protein (haloacid dehalogenase superfamily)
MIAQSHKERDRLILALDLDGTLLRDDKTISEKDCETLNELSERGVVLVAATGRSLRKVQEVIGDEVPFDFIVFSSGAGVYQWKEKNLLVFEKFQADVSLSVSEILLKRAVNFLVFEPIPYNYRFSFHRGEHKYPEFERYIARHEEDSQLFSTACNSKAGQFLVVLPNDEMRYHDIRNELIDNVSGVHVIRTTSPVDNRYLWLEIFPDTVSKGHGVRWVCDSQLVDHKNTIAIGNDYNDIDMLSFVAKPFLVGNAPVDLKNQFPFIKEDNNSDGVSHVIKHLHIL